MSSSTVEGQVDDPTATVTASIVDDSGDSNTVPVVVERNGLVWVRNLPLGDGENTLTITARDAAGNTSVTNLSLYQGSVSVTMNPLASNMFNQPFVTATGTVSDAGCTVTVNGVTATVNTNGTWQATNVPVGPGGTAVFEVEATGSSDPPQLFTQAQPVDVVLMSYTADYAGYERAAGFIVPRYINGTQPVIAPAYTIDGRSAHWTYESGGLDKGYSIYSGRMYDTFLGDWQFYPFSSTWTNQNIPPQQNGLTGLDSEDNPVPSSDGFNPAWEYSPRYSTWTRVMIKPSGSAVTGTTVTYLVQAQAQNNELVVGEDGALLPPASMQIQGVTLTPATNADGSVWGSMLLQVPAGAWPEVTPIAPGSYNFKVKPYVVPFIVDAYTNIISPTNSNNVAIVGQNITLTALVPGMNVSNFQWTVAGTTETNFYVSSSNTFWTNGYPQALTNTNGSSISFFWVDGTYAGESKNVTCSAQYGGVTFSNTVTFTVVRPTISMATATGSVFIDTNDFRLRFGINTPGSVGISFSNVLIMPTNDFTHYYNYGKTNSSTEWVQVISSHTGMETISNSVSNVVHQLETVGTVLDASYPYPNDTISTASDSPSISLSRLGQIYAFDTQTSKMWLMFQPTNGNWVPLWMVTWSCTGSAIGFGEVWNPTGTTNISVLSSGDSGTVYPEWTNNVKNFQFIPPLR